MLLQNSYSISKHLNFKKMKRIFLLSAFLFFMSSTFAQIQGYVYDKTNGKTLPGCTVTVKDYNLSTLTNSKGFFSFTSLPKGELTIEFSYLGYHPYLLRINNNGKKQLVKIFLRPAPVEAEQVVVTAFVPVDQSKSAVQISSESVAKITSFSTPSFIQLLTRIPGVDMISKGVGIATPVIRGLSRTNILVLNQGFRLEDFQFSENHPFFIDPFGTSRIEVIKGPASLLYGSDAIGGVVNVLWENPALENTVHFDQNFQYFTNTRGITENFGLKFTKNNFAQGFRFGYESDADMRDGLGQQVKNTRFLIRTIKGFSVFNHKKINSKFYYEFTQSNLGLCVKPALKMVSDNNRYPENFYQDLLHAFIGTRNNIFLNQSTKLKINMSYEYNIRGLRVKASEPMPIHMDLGSFTYDFKQITEKHNFTFISGLQGFIINNRNLGKVVFLPNYNSWNSGLYTLSKFQFMRINMLMGLRYDFHQIRMNYLNFDKNTYLDTLLSYSNLSASLGGVYFLGQKTIFRINFATGFKNPTAAELGENGIHAFRYEVGNLNLKAERSYESDFGFSYRAKYFATDFSLFYNYIQNYIYLTPTTDTAANGMKVYRYEQMNSRLYGLELSSTFQPLPDLKLRLTYNYLHTRKADGTALPLIPQNKLKLYANYNLGNIWRFQALKLGLWGIYAFAYKNPAPLEEPSKPYFLLNASISAAFKILGYNFSLEIKGWNLLNQAYADHLSSLKDVGYYDMGRNITIGIRMELNKKI